MMRFVFKKYDLGEIKFIWIKAFVFHFFFFTLVD